MSESMHQPEDSCSPAPFTPTVAAEIRATLKRLGDYVRAQLVERGVSVRQAARIVGTPHSTFASHLTSGNFVIDELHYLARDVFGVGMADLLRVGMGEPEATA
jgi:hypothetical protein